MPYETWRVDIHNNIVTGTIMPGGMVSDEVNDVVRNARRLVEFEYAAISRTGKLLRGVSSAFAKPDNPNKTTGRVTSAARHAMWVEEGTRTITPDKGKYLTVPRHSNPLSGGVLRTAWLAGGGTGPKPFFLAKSISGQRGQHIMRDSLGRAMKSKGY